MRGEVPITATNSNADPNILSSYQRQKGYGNIDVPYPYFAYATHPSAQATVLVLLCPSLELVTGDSDHSTDNGGSIQTSYVGEARFNLFSGVLFTTYYRV